MDESEVEGDDAFVNGENYGTEMLELPEKDSKRCVCFAMCGFISFRIEVPVKVIG